MDISSSSNNAVTNMKILVVGDINCGKTSIIRRFVKSEFKDEYKPTVSGEFNMKVLKING